MQIPIYVRPEDDHFIATAAGITELSAQAETHEAAVSAMVSLLNAKANEGQLVGVDVAADPLLRMACKYRDDPWLAEIVEEAYRLRDAEQESLSE